MMKRPVSGGASLRGEDCVAEDDDGDEDDDSASLNEEEEGDGVAL